MEDILETTLVLPPGFQLRRPNKDDSQAITGLIIATEIAETGESDYSIEDLLIDWRRPGYDPGRDAWIVVAPDALVVGYEEVWNRSEHAVLQGDGYVHPEYTGLGIGTTLIRIAENRAREHILLAPAGRRVSLRNGVYGSDHKACRLHENEGFQAIRYFWRMEIEMSEPPPQKEWPAGIYLRNAIPGQDERAVFDAFEEAFRDHWGYTPWDYDWWRQRMFENEGFDPSLWFLAMDREQIAGGALCKYRQQDGWVNQLAVRRPWRRAGLGRALLLHAFNEFYRRGTRKVGLGVDASNPTGATRLYEKAGMHVAHEYIAYEKELRPGEEA